MARWNSCNILQVSPDANRLWQFEAKGSFKLNRELRSESSLPLPANFVGKSWTSLWQPKLNVAWLPPQAVFLRVIQVPAGAFAETVSMVELQLEKLSPLPLAQVVWTLHVLPQTGGDLQTVVVVMAERREVEEFLGKLEERKFMADRLEAPMLDQLEAIAGVEDGAWIFPAVAGVTQTALVAWCGGGVLRHVSFILLPAEGDRAASLKGQLAQLVWAGEMEGWLTARPIWHLVAEGMAAAEWEALLRQALEEPIKVSPPLNAVDLAARTARRATQSATAPAATLLPAEFSDRYRGQFHDRLWLHGLYTTGIVYVILVAFYFSATTWRGYQASKIQAQVAAVSDDYTNAIQLKARFAVLQQREDLKFAALNCWKLVADNLPDGLTLQRFGFGDGQTLSLYGTTTQDQIESLYNFNKILGAAKWEGKRMFKPGEPLSWHQYQSTVDWSFSLDLMQEDKLQ
jgi:hypothetical protein